MRVGHDLSLLIAFKQFQNANKINLNEKRKSAFNECDEHDLSFLSTFLQFQIVNQ